MIYPSGDDDTAAIQAAIDAAETSGQPVELAAGNYTVSARLSVSRAVLRCGAAVINADDCDPLIRLHGAGPDSWLDPRPELHGGKWVDGGIELYQARGAVARGATVQGATRGLWIRGGDAGSGLCDVRNVVAYRCDVGVDVVGPWCNGHKIQRVLAQSCDVGARIDNAVATQLDMLAQGCSVADLILGAGAQRSQINLYQEAGAKPIEIDSAARENELGGSWYRDTLDGVGTGTMFRGPEVETRRHEIAGDSPSVAAGRFFDLKQPEPVTVSMFAGGVQGQEIRVLCWDGNTTLDFAWHSGPRLRGNHGKNYTTKPGDTIAAYCDGTNWWCDIWPA